MKEITVDIGTFNRMRNGAAQDGRRPVTFVGEFVCNDTTFYGNDDTRGITETLYRVENGSYVVHFEEWSKWQGETDVYELHQVNDTDLDVGGAFESLGRKAGIARNLTLEEALNF